MSELLEFRVVDVIGPTARIHVRPIHPDQYDISDAKNFALQIIVEAYWTMREGYLAGNQLRNTEAAARVAAHPRRRELDKLLELMHGADIEITEAEYEALRGNPTKLRAEGLSSIGLRTVHGRPRHVKNRGPAFRTFIREAERIVDNVHLQDEHNNPREDADDPDAEATVVVTVGDSGLLAHLAPGLHWDSAVYDFHGWEDHDKSELGLLN